MMHRVYDTICASIFNIVKGTIPSVLERTIYIETIPRLLILLWSLRSILYPALGVLICVKSFLGSESGCHCLFFDNNVLAVAGSFC